jgi:NitT/TauT family transport system substrate-binding protein
MKKTFFFIITVLAVTLMLAGCGTNKTTSTGSSSNKGSGSTPASASSAPSPKPLTKVTHITSWFAQPEQGGQYAALMKDYYKEAGLDMTIEPGGPKISAIQIVASGKAQFGMGQSDVVLQAREQGIPVVAIGAIFQRSPHALIFHKGANIKDFKDLNGHTLYLSPTLVYWDYMKNKYGLDKAQVMQFDGQMTSFINDKNSAVQGYLTSAPYQLKKLGVEVEYLDVYNSGYTPYATTLFTTEKFMKENPEAVKAFVEATIKGWKYYKDHIEEVNTFLLKYNSNLKMDEMENTAKLQNDLIYTGDALKNGIGYMSKERWEALQKLMLDTGVIKKKEDITKIFTNEFLPK